MKPNKAVKLNYKLDSTKQLSSILLAQSGQA